jgi:hypothetical protein
MKKAIAQAIVQLMEEQGHEASLYEDYSGRSMFGRKTYGVVANNAGTIIGAILSDALEENSILQEVSSLHNISPFDIDSIYIDNMGLDIIIY